MTLVSFRQNDFQIKPLVLGGSLALVGYSFTKLAQANRRVANLIDVEQSIKRLAHNQRIIRIIGLGNSLSIPFTPIDLVKRKQFTSTSDLRPRNLEVPKSTSRKRLQVTQDMETCALDMDFQPLLFKEEDLDEWEMEIFIENYGNFSQKLKERQFPLLVTTLDRKLGPVDLLCEDGLNWKVANNEDAHYPKLLMECLEKRRSQLERHLQQLKAEFSELKYEYEEYANIRSTLTLESILDVSDLPHRKEMHSKAEQRVKLARKQFEDEPPIQEIGLRYSNVERWKKLTTELADQLL